MRQHRECTRRCVAAVCAWLNRWLFGRRLPCSGKRSLAAADIQPLMDQLVTEVLDGEAVFMKARERCDATTARYAQLQSLQQQTDAAWTDIRARVQALLDKKLELEAALLASQRVVDSVAAAKAAPVDPLAKLAQWRAAKRGGPASGAAATAAVPAATGMAASAAATSSAPAPVPATAATATSAAVAASVTVPPVSMVEAIAAHTETYMGSGDAPSAATAAKPAASISLAPTPAAPAATPLEAVSAELAARAEGPLHLRPSSAAAPAPAPAVAPAASATHPASSPAAAPPAAAMPSLPALLLSLPPAARGELLKLLPPGWKPGDPLPSNLPDPRTLLAKLGIKPGGPPAAAAQPQAKG